MSLRMLCLVITLFHGSVAGAAWRAEVSSGQLVLLDEASGKELGRVATGSVRALARQGDVLYAALSPTGVAVIQASDPKAPVVVGTLAGGRSIVRLFVQDGVLFLLEQRLEVEALDLRDPLKPIAAELTSPGQPTASPVAVAPSATAPAAAPPLAPAVSATPPVPPVPSPPPPVAARSAGERLRVVEVKNGRAILDGGADRGIRPGVRLRIRSQREVLKPDLVSGGTRMVPSDEVTAVVQVEHSEETRSMARLARGDNAEPGDLAEPTDEPLSQRLWFPPRSSFTSAFGFTARPFLGVSTPSRSFGALVDLYYVQYLAQAQLRLEIAVAPGAFLLSGAGDEGNLTAGAIVAYAGDYFEIGLGAGFLLGESNCFGTTCVENSGVTIGQYIRLGSVDGLTAVWRSSILSRETQFAFGGGRGELAIPLTNSLSAFGGGGGGANGWYYGEGGVKTYLGGTGARGTMVISASAGVVYVGGGYSGNSPPGAAGPSVSIGVEWRR